jgi:hypothetical protein
MGWLQSHPRLFRACERLRETCSPHATAGKAVVKNSEVRVMRHVNGPLGHEKQSLHTESRLLLSATGHPLSERIIMTASVV